ncbi:ABC transporter [Spirosomataceae bacterium TFI 002]|nr:ABC transporter [Spirosomataceae bacterium TFI 002]
MRIELENIAKKFKNEWIFRNLSYTFHTSKSYAILGSNGSGKSTLISIISGINPASKGELKYVVDEKTLDPDDIHSHISFAAPYMELIEELTLLESLRFHAKFRPFVSGMDEEAFLERVFLTAHKDKFINQFSSGMKQRLKLAFALFFQSDCVLLDEPTTNLDDQGVVWYLENVQAFSKERILIISSNNKTEYNFCEEQIDITNFKK